MHNQRKIGVALNYLNMLLRVLSGFWVTRIIINTLGMAEYGLISIAGSVLVLLPLFDFGMTAAITRFSAQYRAMNDMEGLRNFLGLCQKFFYAIAALSALLCTVLYFQLDHIFPRLSADEMDKTRIMFIMLSCGSVINFTQCLYSNVLSAFQRYLFTGLLSTFTLLFTAIGSVLFVWNGYGAVGVTAVGLALHLVNMFPARFYCWKKLGLVPNIRYWDWGLMKKCLHYSIWVFLGTISSMAGENLAPLIIGSACGPVETGVYRVGMIVTGYLAIGCNVSGVFFPKVVEMVTHNAGRRQLTDCFIRVGRIDFMLALLLVGGFYLLGNDFLNLWLRKDAELAAYASMAWKVGMVCSFFLPIAASFGIGWQVLHAKNLLKFRVLVSLGSNLVASGLGYILALEYGLFGLLWCRFALPGLLLIIFTVIYFDRVAGLDMKSFMKHTYGRTLVPIVFSSIVMVVVLHFYPIEEWEDFIVNGMIYTVVFAVAAWAFALNLQEKDMVFFFLSKLKRGIYKGLRLPVK